MRRVFAECQVEEAVAYAKENNLWFRTVGGQWFTPESVEENLSWLKDVFENALIVDDPKQYLKDLKPFLDKAEQDYYRLNREFNNLTLSIETYENGKTK